MGVEVSVLDWFIIIELIMLVVIIWLTRGMLL